MPIFNNFNDAWIYNNYNIINTWNIPKESGTNIIGGPNLGGNFWANTGGTGVSQRCPDVNGDGICDQSYYIANYNFDYLPLARYTAPGITGVLPNGGETFPRGTTRTIRWNYTGSPGSYVNITLLKGGVLNSIINSNTSIGSTGSGSYSWLINSTQTPAGDYKVMVTSTSNSAYNDTSDDVFTISSPALVADCGPDKLKCENVGAPVQFNGSESYETDGVISSYYWDFGDGTNGTSAAPMHTYSMHKWNGTFYEPFIANLTVTDNIGLTNTTSQNVVIWMAGDVNGDGNVNILDASVVGLKWGGNDPCADLNNDGSVNILDASIIGLNWGKIV